MTPAAAFAFMLAAPAINPVVLVSTAVAFPGRPEVVGARFVASLVTAVAVGLLWARLGRDAWIDRARHGPVEGGTRWQSFTQTAQHDFLHAGGWLEIEGRWQQRTSDDPNQPSSQTPLLLAESVRMTRQPPQPYESGFPF